MKKKCFLYFLTLIGLLGLFGSFSSCQKDNYDAPKTKFTGHLVYKGTPIQVKNNGLDGDNLGISAVYFELWQEGYGKSGPIDVYVNQDGSFSSLLYNGAYKLVIPPAQGPFISITNTKTGSDTIDLNLNGDVNMDIEVLPYYMVEKALFNLSKDSIVTATASIDKIITDDRAKDIEYVGLYVNRTSFVDEDNHIAFKTVAKSDIQDLGNISFSAKIPEDISGGNIGIADQDYFFARVGVKIAGVDDMIFSNIVKVSYK